MFKLKTTFFALALVGVVATVSGSSGFAQSKPTIGIAMPTKSSARWIDDGNNMVKVLKERGDRRHYAFGRAQAGQGRRHHRDRLRPPDPRHAKRRLLRDLRQFPGRRV